MTKVRVNDNSKFENINWKVGDYFKRIEGEIYMVARIGQITALVCLNDGGFWESCDKISGTAEDLNMGQEGEFIPVSNVEISIC